MGLLVERAAANGRGHDDAAPGHNAGLPLTYVWWSELLPMRSAVMRRGTALLLLSVVAQEKFARAWQGEAAKVVARAAASTMRRWLPAAGAVAAGIVETTETLEHYSELCSTGVVESARAVFRVLAHCTKVFF